MGALGTYVPHNPRGSLKLATTAGVMAIHCHGNNVVVTVTRGAGDALAHCQYASAGGSEIQTMVGAHSPALGSWPKDAC